MKLPSAKAVRNAHPDWKYEHWAAYQEGRLHGHREQYGLPSWMVRVWWWRR